MAQIASGQITITDLNDGRSFISRITDNFNSGGYFSYDPDNDSYFPSLDSGITLTASLITTANGTNILPGGIAGDVEVRGIQWYRGTTLLTGKTSNVLNLSKAEIFPAENTSENSIPYTVKFQIKEAIFGLEAPWIAMEQTYTFNRIRQGSGANYIILTATPGDTFVNAGEADVITINSRIFKNGKELATPQAAYFKWQYFDDETGAFVEISKEAPDLTAKALKVTAGEVFGSEVFRYLYDFTEQGAFSGEKAMVATIVIIDYTDPITVNITSNAGDVFKPGMSEKTLTANVYVKKVDRHELMPDPTTKYSFKWKAYDKDGTNVPTGGFVPGAKENEIKVQPAHVNVSATFITSVEEKVELRRSYARANGFRAYLLNEK